MRNDEPVADGTDGRTTRRRVLATAAGLAAAGVAGCSDPTNREFEATPAVLPEDARRELALGEVLLESQTTTRQVEAVDGEVTLTSYAAAYTREEAYPAPRPDFGEPSADAPLRQTLLERFLGRVNGTKGPGAASVAAASDLGVDEVGLDLGGNVYDVASDRVGVVAPAGLRGGTEAPISGPYLLALLDSRANPSPIQADYAVPAKDFIPGPRWLDRGGNGYEPSRRWVPGSGRGTFDWPTPDNFSPDAPVLVALGDHTAEEVFGVPAAEMPGERFEGGEVSQPIPSSVMVAAPGTVAEEVPPDLWDPAEVFGVGGPAPLAGATYGVGVLSTPNAEVAGQSVNPLVRMPLADLVTGDAARRLVGEAAFPGLVYEWADGPAVVGDVPDGTEFADVTLLDEAAETATLGGVAHGGPGPFPWFVLGNVARVTNGDSAVVAAGVQRTPVAEDYPWLDRLRGGTEQPFNPFLDWARNGGEMTGRASELFVLDGDVDVA